MPDTGRDDARRRQAARDHEREMEIIRQVGIRQGYGQAPGPKSIPKRGKPGRRRDGLFGKVFGRRRRR